MKASLMAHCYQLAVDSVKEGNMAICQCSYQCDEDFYYQRYLGAHQSVWDFWPEMTVGKCKQNTSFVNGNLGIDLQIQISIYY